MTARANMRRQKSLLITGGAGFLGANFVRYWSGQYPEDALVVLDLLTYAGDRSRLADLETAGAVTVVVGDICDEALVRALLLEHRIDTLVHFAAESHVDRSIQNAAPFVRTNVLGTQSLLDAARGAWRCEGRWRAGCGFIMCPPTRCTDRWPMTPRHLPRRRRTIPVHRTPQARRHRIISFVLPVSRMICPIPFRIVPTTLGRISMRRS